MKTKTRIPSATALAAALPLAALLTALPLAAQDHATHSHYAGMQDREIKALSGEEIASLLAGEGMGFAMAAELNGIPGPKHVLELAEQLEIMPEQRDRVQAIFDEMAVKAQALGRRLVDAERMLDQAFGHANPPAEHIAQMVKDAGAIRAELRAVHLLAHLTTAAALNETQIERYAELRGYR